MNIQEIDYHGWKSIHISNGTIECIVPLEIGIRMLHLALVADHENCLFERETDRPDSMHSALLESRGRAASPVSVKKSNEWQLFGGHRLWFAPEDEARSYIPDNQPISYNIASDEQNARAREEGAKILQLQEPISSLRIQKEIDLEFLSANKLRVTHRARNHSEKAFKLSLWPITAFAGGRATLPMPTSNRQLNAAGSIVLWPYTKPNDERIAFDTNAGRMTIDQKPGTQPLKIGLAHGQTGVLALSWERGSLRFRKTFENTPGNYPDFGSCIECYTNHELIELETLGPEVQCAPGEFVEHTEIWELWRAG